MMKENWNLVDRCLKIDIRTLFMVNLSLRTPSLYPSYWSRDVNWVPDTGRIQSLIFVPLLGSLGFKYNTKQCIVCTSVYGQRQFCLYTLIIQYEHICCLNASATVIEIKEKYIPLV